MKCYSAREQPKENETDLYLFLHRIETASTQTKQKQEKKQDLTTNTTWSDFSTLEPNSSSRLQETLIKYLVISERTKKKGLVISAN